MKCDKVELLLHCTPCSMVRTDGDVSWQASTLLVLSKEVDMNSCIIRDIYQYVRVQLFWGKGHTLTFCTPLQDEMPVSAVTCSRHFSQDHFLSNEFNFYEVIFSGMALFWELPALPGAYVGSQRYRAHLPNLPKAFMHSEAGRAAAKRPRNTTEQSSMTTPLLGQTQYEGRWWAVKWFAVEAR